MATFPIRDDEYSVEEISYEEMMAVLAIQEQKISGAESSTTPLSQLTPSEIDAKPLHTQNSLSRRIKENANRELPDWLLNS